MEPYFSMSKSLYILEAQGRWDKCHGVPPETVQRMASRWEELPPFG